MILKTTPLTPIALRALPQNRKNTDLWEEIGIICEGVKQICLLLGNKKNIFIPAGVNMFFTPSQTAISSQAGRPSLYKNAQNMAFLAQKMPFVNNCELYIFTVYYY